MEKKFGTQDVGGLCSDKQWLLRDIFLGFQSQWHQSLYDIEYCSYWDILEQHIGTTYWFPRFFCSHQRHPVWPSTSPKSSAQETQIIYPAGTNAVLWQADQKQQKIFQGPKAEGDFSLGQKES
jgi:hypothetical protein